MWLAIFSGLSFLIASLLWYIWAGRRLRSERGSIGGKSLETSAPRFRDLKTMLENSHMEAVYLLNLQDNLPSANWMLQSFTGQTTPQSYDMNRKLRIVYSSSQYINQTFELQVSIGSEDGKLPEVIDKKRIATKPGERLQFVSYEVTPLLQVEVQFAEGDFNTNTKAQQKLLESGITEFMFLLKPLKAEKCILTVVISYISNIQTPDQITQKVTIDKIINTIASAGTTPTTTEHIEQVTTTPASALPQVVKTDDITVAVKSVLGMNSDELTLCKNGLGIVAALVLLAIALISHQTTGADAIAWGIAALVNVLGIPVIDSGAKLLHGKDASA